MRGLLVIALVGSTFASMSMAQEDPVFQIVAEDGQCFAQGAQYTDRLAIYNQIMGDEELSSIFEVTLLVAFQRVYGDSPNQFACELLYGLSSSLEAEYKEVSTENIRLLLPVFLTGMLGDKEALAAHEERLAALPNSASRAGYWHARFSGGLNAGTGLLLDALKNATRISDGLESYEVRSGGTVYDVEEIMRSTKDYYAVWAHPELGKPGYSDPAFFTFKDDAGAVHIAIIDTDNVFHVFGPVDAGQIKREIEETRARLSAEGVQNNSHEKAIEKVARTNPGLGLMVKATERSWEFEPMGLLRSLGLFEANPDKIRDFHEFSRSMASRLKGAQ